MFHLQNWLNLEENGENMTVSLLNEVVEQKLIWMPKDQKNSFLSFASFLKNFRDKCWTRQKKYFCIDLTWNSSHKVDLDSKVQPIPVNREISGFRHKMKHHVRYFPKKWLFLLQKLV